MISVQRIVVLLVAAVLAAACSPAAPRRTAPSPVLTLPAPDPAIDYSHPERVCAAFGAAVYRVDTTVDTGPADAYHRAAAYVDAALAAAISGQQPVQTPQWQEWASHRARVEVRVDPYAGDALPPARDDEQHHGVLVTAVPVGRDGWRGPAALRTVVCTLRPAGGSGWRISGYETG